MNTEEAIEKVAAAMVRAEEECAKIHTEIKRVLVSDEIQKKLTYIFNETVRGRGTAISLEGFQKTFYRDDLTAPWYCHVDGGHKTCEVYKVHSMEQVVATIQKSCGWESEKELIARLREYLQSSVSGVADYKRFDVAKAVSAIDRSYESIKAERSKELESVLAEFNL